MPPLRERKDDILPLATHVHPPLRQRAEEEARRARHRRAEAADALQLAGQHPRARERDRARGAARRSADDHAPTTCGSATSRRRARDASRSASSRFRRPASPLEEIERQALIEALKMSNWVQKDAAELLSISPRVMNYKIKTLGIEMPRRRCRRTVATVASWSGDAARTSRTVAAPAGCVESRPPVASRGLLRARVRLAVDLDQLRSR